MRGGGAGSAPPHPAGRNPHVVDRPRSPALDGCRGQPPPGGGYRLVAGQYRNAGQPAGEFLTAALAQRSSADRPNPLTGSQVSGSLAFVSTLIVERRRVVTSCCRSTSLP
jgi:hypothetical protein